MKKATAGIIFLLAIILVTYLTSYYFSKNKIEAQNRTELINIGWIGPITGAAFALGVDNLNAVKLALSEYEATKGATDPEINLMIADDKYDMTNTKRAFEEMMTNAPKPTAFFISTYSGILTLGDKALQDSVLIIDPIDNDQKLASINRNIFLIAKETESMASVTAYAAIDQGKKNVSIIYYADDDFMPNLANLVRKILEYNKLTVNLYSYERGTKDFYSILKTAHSYKSDAFMFFGYMEVGLAMKQAREVGITAIFYSTNYLLNPIAKKKSGEANEGTFFAHYDALYESKVEVDGFIHKYYDRYRSRPFLDWTAVQAYDAATILFEAIKTVSHKKGHFIDNLREELLSTRTFKGLSGNITILPTGASRGIYLSLYVLKNGDAIPISAASMKGTP